MASFSLLSRRFSLRWAGNLTYTLFIFASLPFFPDIWNYLNGTFPDGMQWFSKLFLPLSFLVFILTCTVFARRRSLLLYFGIAVITSAFYLMVRFYCEYTAERMHLAEYVLLSVLAYRAFSVRFKSLAVYALSFLYCAIVGLCDESIQGLLPNRVYELKDLCINWASSLLGIGLIFGFTWRRHIAPALKPFVGQAAMAAAVLMLTGQGLFFYRAYINPALNVILITVDTCRPDFVGFFGQRPAKTPHIDQLAEQGLVFSNVVSAAPWTSPAMLSLFTGLYPSAHGVTARGRSLPQGTTTVFDVFRKHGYRIPNIAYLTNIQNFENLGLEPREDIYFRSAEGPGDELISWIRDHRFEKFFAWYHYRFLHLPYTGDLETVTPNDTLKESPAVRAVMRDAVIPRGSVSFSREDQERVRQLYADQYLRLDRFLDRLTHLLKRCKLSRKTLLVITADHGEELFEHGFVGHASTAVHATLFDEVLRIPLIISCPLLFQSGLAFSDPVRQIDIMPTLLDLTGLPIPVNIQGTSLLPLALGQAGFSAPPALSESNAGGYQSRPEQENVQLRSIRTKRWKLILSEHDNRTAPRLYDLRKDPFERSDVFKTFPEVSQQLSQQLHSAVAEMHARQLQHLISRPAAFPASGIPPEAALSRPTILLPLSGQSLQVDKESRLDIKWSGDPEITYVVEYDIGTGWRNLKGRFSVRGNSRVFGPLPPEAWEPLPYWNPYRIRVSPYGLPQYWSDWVRFTIEHP